MFDIGFFEILVIAVVGLVVIGPERLPETVRTIGLWLGRLKRSLRETRTELEKQIGADDIRRQLHNEEVMRSLENSRRQIEDAVQEGSLPQRKTRRYREEKELPDHAHGADPSEPSKEGSSAATDSANTRESTVASGQQSSEQQASEQRPSDSTPAPASDPSDHKSNS